MNVTNSKFVNPACPLPSQPSAARCSLATPLFRDSRAPATLLGSGRRAICLLLVFALLPAASLSAQSPPQPTGTAPSDAPVDATKAAGTQWPMDRGDLSANGTTTEKLPERLTELWRYQAGQGLETSPVIDAGRVFVVDIDGGMHGIDLQTGAKLWYHKTPNGFLAPPSVADNRVVIGDFDGIVYAVEATTGKPLWNVETGGEIDAGVTLLPDRVLVSSQDGSLYALQPDNGQALWTYTTGDQVRCRPAVAGERTFLGGCDGKLHIVNIKDGTEAAESIPLDGPTGSTVAIVGDRAYLPTQTGSVIAFDWKTGKQLWTYIDPDRPQEFRNSAAATDKHVIVASKNRQVISLHPDTGAVQWSATIQRRADASPVIAADDVWITATDGRIYRFALDDGRERWQYELRGSIIAPPAIADNKLIVAIDDGTVVCFADADLQPAK